MIKPLFRKLRKRYHEYRHEHLDKFYFVHINKTGGSSVESALNIPFEHKTALEKIAEVGRDRWDQRFTFAIFRNPWDKVVSHYSYRRKTNQTGMGDDPIPFAQWLRATYRDKDPEYYDKPRMFMPQMDWVCDEQGELIVDEIIRFENLSTEFNALSRRIGRGTELPHIKKSNRGKYVDYYDDEGVEIVAQWFARDIEHFGYEFG